MALPTVQLDSAALQAHLVSVAPRPTEIYRRHYGNSIDMAAIANAIEGANVGLMSDLTDLEQESFAVDPHLSGLASKRFGSLQVAPLRVQPACPPGGDKEVAKEIAQSVRYAFDSVPHLSERIYDYAWALCHGRAAQEIHWQRVVGGFGPVSRFSMSWAITSLQWIHPRNLSFGPRRELRYIDPMRQSGYFTNSAGFALDDFAGKFLTWTPRMFCEYPEREGLGPRSLYWSFFKRFSWRYRMLLTELFGVPWRIVRSDSNQMIQPSADAITAARNAAEALGGETTAAFAPGITMDVILPKGDSGALFQMTSDDVDKQNSKLWLGQTGTTDPMSAGLGSNQANVMNDEQAAIRARDAMGAGERLRMAMARPLVLANFGEEAAAQYTPFVLIDVATKDRKSDLEALKTYVDMGGTVAAEEARERAGVREVEPGEEVLVPPAAPDPFGGMGAVPAPVPGVLPNARVRIAPVGLRFGGW